MARYYFHLSDGTTIRDREGWASADLATAERHARRVALEVGRNKPPSEVEGQSISVTDEQGKQVFSTPVVAGEQ
jgi:hypothetical protein